MVRLQLARGSNNDGLGSLTITGSNLLNSLDDLDSLGHLSEDDVLAI
jgi:hypothetical protein